jgi:hypothetical protein
MVMGSLLAIFAVKIRLVFLMTRMSGELDGQWESDRSSPERTCVSFLVDALEHRCVPNTPGYPRNDFFSLSKCCF